MAKLLRAFRAPLRVAPNQIEYVTEQLKKKAFEVVRELQTAGQAMVEMPELALAENGNDVCVWSRPDDDTPLVAIASFRAPYTRIRKSAGKPETLQHQASTLQLAVAQGTAVLLPYKSCRCTGCSEEFNSLYYVRGNNASRIGISRNQDAANRKIPYGPDITPDVGHVRLHMIGEHKGCLNHNM